MLSTTDGVGQPAFILQRPQADLISCGSAHSMARTSACDLECYERNLPEVFPPKTVRVAI